MFAWACVLTLALNHINELVGKSTVHFSVLCGLIHLKRLDYERKLVNSSLVALLFTITGCRATQVAQVSHWAIMHLVMVMVVVFTTVLPRQFANSLLPVIKVPMMALVLMLILVAVFGPVFFAVVSCFTIVGVIFVDTYPSNVPCLACLGRAACLASRVIPTISIALPLHLELWYFGRNYFYLVGGGVVHLSPDFFIIGICCLTTTDHLNSSVDGELFPFT